jgi:perosamine synthetase
VSKTNLKKRFKKARHGDLPAIAGGSPVRDTNLPYGFHWIGEAEERELLDTLRHGWLTSGPKTAAFENDFAQFTDSRHAVALSSASAALHLSLLALEVGPGDEVITTPLTFVATANAILHVGAKPVFADVDTETLNLDPANVARLINRRTKVILPVHYAGQPCDMAVFKKMARKHRLRIVEDASHAVGATAAGQKVGSIGDLTCFSFHPVKNMTSAEGGMITTNVQHLAAKIRALRFHGLMEDFIARAKREKFHYPRMRLLGFKYVMTDLQASLAIHQLKRVPEFTDRRAALAERYRKAFENVPEIRCPVVRAGVTSAWHLYVIRLDLSRLLCSRDEFIDALKAENISASVHYLPVHLHPYYAKRFGFCRGDLPNAEKAYSEIVTLPLFPRMRDEDINDVVVAVKQIVRYFGTNS